MSIKILLNDHDHELGEQHGAINENEGGKTKKAKQILIVATLPRFNLSRRFFLLLRNHVINEIFYYNRYFILDRAYSFAANLGSALLF